MNKKVLFSLFIFLLLLLLIPVSCFSKPNFSSDPIKWTYVSGDGSWNSNSRKWTVFLKPNETKSITIRIYNSGSETKTIYTVPTGPTDNILLSRQVSFSLRPGESADTTFTAVSNQYIASGKYIIDYSSSYNVSPQIGLLKYLM